MSKVLCIYHANCADGFGAAWAVHRALGDDVEFVAAKYGDSLLYTSNRNEKLKEQTGLCMGEFKKFVPLEGRNVLFVDFSASLSDLRAMAAEARSVVVLDHHKTAQKDLESIWNDADYKFQISEWLKDPDTGDATRRNLAAIFDMDRSGAGITWDYLSGGQPRPRIIDLVEDRDLWRFKHDSDTRQFHAVAASYGYEPTPENFARWDEWDRISLPIGTVVLTGVWADLMNEGEAILRYERRLVEGIVHSTRPHDADRRVRRPGRLRPRCAGE